jgi:hypothetical protein
VLVSLLDELSVLPQALLEALLHPLLLRDAAPRAAALAADVLARQAEKLTLLAAQYVKAAAAGVANFTTITPAACAGGVCAVALSTCVTPRRISSGALAASRASPSSR